MNCGQGAPTESIPKRKKMTRGANKAATSGSGSTGEIGPTAEVRPEGGHQNFENHVKSREKKVFQASGS